MSGPLAVALLLALAVPQDPKLNIDQQTKLRLAKLDKNNKTRMVDDILKDYAPAKGKPDFLLSPAALKKQLDTIGVLEGACNRILKDFKDVSMPENHGEAKTVREWAEQSIKAVAEAKTDYEARLPEAEKLADPKNYPDLEKDSEALTELTADYRKGLQGSVEEVAGRASRFPKVLEWRGERFKKYRAFMIMNGGAKNPLYVKFAQSGEVLKKIQEEATAFVRVADTDVPKWIKEAEETAAAAAAEKKPAFFEGGVKQKMDCWAREKVAVSEALTGKESPHRKELEAAQGRIDAKVASLKDLILAEARAPKENYAGADKEEHRKRILEEWKKAHPADAVLEVRFPNNWERKTEWRVVGDALQKVDMSYLYGRVIVKTGDKIASLYVAVVNKNHMKGDEVSYGVRTKGGIWVVEEMLLENIGK